VNIVRQRLTEPGSQMPKFIVLDFSRVSGLDSSTAASFARMKQLADARDVQIAMANLSPSMLHQLKMSEDDGLAGVHFYPTPDEAMEWCENQILAAKPQPVLTEEPAPVEPPAPLEQFFPKPEEAQALLAYLEKVEHGAGEQLIRQGDPADALYLVESGAATAILELPDGRSLRLRTTTRGTIFGEIGLYLGRARTASVVLTEPTRLFRLSQSGLEAMEQNNPQLAAIFHKRIAVLLAERLAENNDTLAALMD
jgi:SulP family sulfate permease